MAGKHTTRNLTQKGVQGLTPHPDRDYMVADASVPGFWVRVYPTGAKVFLLRFKDAGKARVQRRLGTWPDLSVDEARDKAKVIIGRATSGEQQALDPKCFKAVAEEYMNARVRPSAGVRTLQQYDDQLHRILYPALGRLRMDEIETHHVLAVLSKYARRPMWNRLLTGLVRPIFRYAAMRRLIHADPVSFIEKVPEAPRKPSLSQAQVHALNLAITELRKKKRITEPVAWAFRLLLATGARSNEILNLQWTFVDEELGIIRWPKTKTGQKVFPLTPVVKDILGRIPRRPDHAYVIPGERAGQPLTYLRKAWRLIRTQAGVPDLRIHDLRHAFGTRARRVGDLLDAKELLAHKQVSTTEIYTRAEMDDLGKVAEEAARWMLTGSPLEALDAQVAHTNVPDPG